MLPPPEPEELESVTCPVIPSKKSENHPALIKLKLKKITINKRTRLATNFFLFINFI